jgi:hypothetical protein
MYFAIKKTGAGAYNGKTIAQYKDTNKHPCKMVVLKMWVT